MKKIAPLILLFLACCTLNADQEVSLNNARFAYINSRNNGVVMSYVAYTHPNVVDYYKTLGDSNFTMKFDLFQYGSPYELNDGGIVEMKSEAKSIHVKYRYTSITLGNNKMKNDDFIILAISDDDGSAWYFMDEDDYLNDKIMDPSDRLIK